MAYQVANVRHLHAQDTTRVLASRAPQPTIAHMASGAAVPGHANTYPAAATSSDQSRCGPRTRDPAAGSTGDTTGPTEVPVRGRAPEKPWIARTRSSPGRWALPAPTRKP